MTSPLEQKIKITGPVVVTANRVGDGAVVYRRANGGWSTHLDDAAVATDTVGARELMSAAAADDLRAVGPYVARLQLAPGGHVRPGEPARAHSPWRSDHRASGDLRRLRHSGPRRPCTSMTHSTGRS